MPCTLASAAAVVSQPHSARQFLKRNEICVATVHQRLQRRQVQPEALQLEQVQAVHKFLQHQQHLGAIASAADVIEALPESLLRPVGELKALFTALRNGGFERQLLSQLLTTAPAPTLAEAAGSSSSSDDARHGSASSSQDSSLSSLGNLSSGGGVPGVLLVPPDEVVARLAHLSALLDLPEDRLPQFVSTRPALLAAPASQVAAAARWLGSVLGWSAMGLLKCAAQWPGLLCRAPEDLDAVACRVQHALDLTTAELVLVLHIAPQLLLLQHDSPQLDSLLEACSASVRSSSRGSSSSGGGGGASSGSSGPAAAGAAAGVPTRQAASPALALAKAAAPHPPAWDVWASQAHQQRLAVLKLCSAHGASLQELGEVLKARPTILREVRV